MAIDDKILNAIRGGFTDGGVGNLDADELRQLKTAFFEGYQRRLGYAELGGCSPTYFVAELDDSSLKNLTRHGQFKLLSSATVDEYSSVTNAYLVPSAGNEITCVSVDHGVSLKTEIAEESFATLPDEQEVYVYCSSQAPDQLHAFRNMAEGRWGDKVDSNPCFGLGNSIAFCRETKRNLDGHKVTIDPTTLIESHFFHTAHPLSSAFLRISKQTLKCMSSDSGLTILTGRSLKNFDGLKLKLNCVPFWNQQIRSISGSDIKRQVADNSIFRIDHGVPYPDNPQAINVRILVCKDVRNNYYFSRDTIGFNAPDAGHIVEVKQINQSGRLATTVKFPESITLGPNDLSIVYAYNQASTRVPDSFDFGSYKFKVRSSKLIDAGNDPWQEMIYPELQRFVTRADIRQSFIRFAPLVLHDSLQAVNPGKVRILTQLRKIPSRLQPEYGLSRMAVPAVVIELGIEFPLEEDFENHYTSLWEQRIEERCPAGTVVQIEWQG